MSNNPTDGVGGEDDLPAAAAAALAVAAAAAVQNVGAGTENPVAFLHSLIAATPSKNGLQQLASFASSHSFKDHQQQQQQQNDNSSNLRSNVAALYLQAAVQHLPTASVGLSYATISSSTTAAASPNANLAVASASSLVANVTAGVMALPVVAALAGSSNNNNNNETTQQQQQPDPEAKTVHDIIEAIGQAVTCVTPRSLISESGILPTMRRLIPQGQQPSSSLLTPIHVEFLQACVFAGHYRYAEQSILHRHDWPRPTSTSASYSSFSSFLTVQHVLRYYYLRGVCHLACEHYLLAKRSFWICLAIPSELCSAIAIAAWKKLVLVQCRIQAMADTNQIAPLKLPPATPQCLVRFLNQAGATSGSVAGGKSGSKKKQPQQSILLSNLQDDASDAAAAPEMDASSVMHMVEMAGMVDTFAPENTQAPGHPPQQQQAPPLQPSYYALGVEVYAQLTAAFGQGDATAYKSLMRQHQAFLASDGNYGLATQIQSILQQRQVYLWSRVYSQITTEELTQLLQLESTTQTCELLVKMSLEDGWPVQFLDDGRIVEFPAWPALPQYHDKDDDTNENSVQDLMNLTQLMQHLDMQVAASSKFQTLSSRGGSNKDPTSTFLPDKAFGGISSSSRPRGVENV